MDESMESDSQKLQEDYLDYPSVWPPTLRDQSETELLNKITITGSTIPFNVFKEMCE